MKEETFIDFSISYKELKVIAEVIKRRLKTEWIYHPDGLTFTDFIKTFALPEDNRELFTKWLAGDPTTVLISDLNSEGFIDVVGDRVFISEGSFEHDFENGVTPSQYKPQLVRGEFMQWSFRWVL